MSIPMRWGPTAAQIDRIFAEARKRIHEATEVQIDRQIGVRTFLARQLDTFWSAEPNGTYTLTVRVNGGAHDTGGEMGFFGRLGMGKAARQEAAEITAKARKLDRAAP